MSTKSESIKVLVRVRPLNDSERNDNNDENGVIAFEGNQKLSITNADGNRTFQCEFDHIFDPKTSQETVYASVRECTSSVLDGFNSTIFAYGQTGSGKTHTMFGPPNDVGNNDMNRSKSLSSTNMKGLIPRAIEEIFSMSAQKQVISQSVYCSFVQIYNENLFDMLRDSSMMVPLSIREDKSEIYVQGLSEYNVKSVQDTLHLLRVAEENRAIRETHMNQFSSRSHSIFQIYVEQKRMADDGGEESIRAKFNLVDLAGSEKWNTRKEMQEEHITEMTNINKSLHTLGRCISSLAQKSTGKDAHVPYRDSKLTRLLQDSLGGNARTFLIATLSPARLNAHESISTLKFADRAKQVMVQAHLNVTRPVDHELVQRLQREVEHLRTMLRQLSETIPGGNINALSSENELAMVSHVSNSSGASSPVSSMLTNTGLAASSGPAALLLQLERALNSEREKNISLEKENEELKNEIQKYKQRSNSSYGRQQSSASGSRSRPATGRHRSDLHSAGSSSSTADGDKSLSAGLIFDKERVEKLENTAYTLHTLHDQNTTLWRSLESIQNNMQDFFGFIIEEDTLKDCLRRVFEELGPVATSAPPAQLGQQASDGAAMLLALGQEGLKASTVALTPVNILRNGSRSASPVNMWNDPSSPVGPVRFRSHSRSDSATPNIDSGRDGGFVSFDIVEGDASNNTNSNTYSNTKTNTTSNKSGNKENQEQTKKNTNNGNHKKSKSQSSSYGSSTSGPTTDSHPSPKTRAGSANSSDEDPPTNTDTEVSAARIRPETHSSVITGGRPTHLPAPPASAGPNPYPTQSQSPNSKDSSPSNMKGSKTKSQESSPNGTVSHPLSINEHENVYANTAMERANQVLTSLSQAPPSPSALNPNTMMSINPITGQPISVPAVSMGPVSPAYSYQAQFQASPLQAIQHQQMLQQQQQMMLQQLMLQQQSLDPSLLQQQPNNMNLNMNSNVANPYQQQQQHQNLQQQKLGLQPNLNISIPGMPLMQSQAGQTMMGQTSSLSPTNATDMNGMTLPHSGVGGTYPLQLNQPQIIQNSASLVAPGPTVNEPTNKSQRRVQYQDPPSEEYLVNKSSYKSAPLPSIKSTREARGSQGIQDQNKENNVQSTSMKSGGSSSKSTLPTMPKEAKVQEKIGRSRNSQAKEREQTRVVRSNNLAPATKSNSPTKIGPSKAVKSLPSSEKGPPSLSFRVRGSQESNNSDWKAPPTNEEEEEILKKELKKARNKMRKQEQLQEWLRIKEERAVVAQQQLQEEARRAQEIDNEKEKKRQARAKKQKKKLVGYQNEIKYENQKIQELLSYGIDPESLVV